MSVEQQPLVPSEISGAGRFAGGGYSPSPVTLGSPVKLFDRYDGTYFHPAPSATAEHCINFWANVEIPDEIITQVEDAYYRDRQQEIIDDMEDTMRDWAIEWMKTNPAPGKREGSNATEAYNQRFRDEHEAHRIRILPQVEAKRPIALGSYDSTQIIRAAQMGMHRPDPNKFPGEIAKVMMQPIELFDGHSVVHEIHKKYDVPRFAPYIQALVEDDSASEMLEALETTNELLRAWQYERSEERIHELERNQ